MELLHRRGPLSIKEMAELLHPGVEITKDVKEYQATKQLVYRAMAVGRIAQDRFDRRYHLPHEDGEK